MLRMVRLRTVVVWFVWGAVREQVLQSANACVYEDVGGGVCVLFFLF